MPPLQFRDQHLFDIGRESLATHRSPEDPGHNKRVSADAHDEALCAP